MPKSGAFDQLGGQLFSEAPDLQVTPRRRLFGTQTLVVPAGGSSTFVVLSPFTADALAAPSDGLLFDLLMILASAGAPGLLVNGVSEALDTPTLAGLPLPNQPIFTITAFSAVNNFTANMTPNPAMLSRLDLDFLSALGVAFLPVIGPVRTRTNVTISNPTAGAISATVQTFSMIRIVRGLQEG